MFKINNFCGKVSGGGHHGLGGDYGLIGGMVPKPNQNQIYAEPNTKPFHFLFFFCGASMEKSKFSYCEFVLKSY